MSGPALAKAVPGYFEPEPSEAAALSAEWPRNWEYFRYHLTPEMTQPNRDDQQACLTCSEISGS